MELRKLVLLLLLAAAHEPVVGFYCGHALVLEGDYKLQVLEKCGYPDFQENRIEYRSTVIRGSEIGQSGFDIIREVPVTIEEWTYDFGPHRFMQWLYFENGRLLLIKNLGYGTMNGSP